MWTKLKSQTSRIFEDSMFSCLAANPLLICADSAVRATEASQTLLPPTGLEPGTTALADSQPIFCDAVVLHWNSTTAPGGYFVQLNKLPNLEGSSTVVFDNRVLGNQFKPPSTLEAGTYEWTVASLGTSGERSGSAPLRYFKCNPRIKAPLAHLPLSGLAQPHR